MTDEWKSLGKWFAGDRDTVRQVGFVRQAEKILVEVFANGTVAITTTGRVCPDSQTIVQVIEHLESKGLEKIDQGELCRQRLLAGKRDVKTDSDS